jgi:hypothetical protein
MSVLITAFNKKVQEAMQALYEDMIFLISILSLRWWYVDLKATSSEQ